MSNKIKFRFITQFKTPLPIERATEIGVTMPYENGETLNKSTGKVADGPNGVAEIELTDFELQGLKIGETQTMLAHVVIDNRKYKAIVANAFSVGVVNERKILL